MKIRERMSSVKSALILYFILLTTGYSIAQQPQILRGAGSKYVYLKSTNNDNDFINVAQFRIGNYLTLGNFGKTNASWIGQNAILDYSSYNGLGSNGNNNKFIPTYANGMALVINFGITDGKMTGYTHSWGGSSAQIDIVNFDKSWELGPTKSFFMENVGIGTETPTAKLHVDGNIIAEEIKVEVVDPPDFVFAPNYNLMLLTEIEAYIKQNHHLPEVPSATEMEANGIELGKMNMLLLQKIEELTLLMIEQQKENIEQKAINKSQQIQLDILQNKIDEKFNK